MKLENTLTEFERRVLDYLDDLGICPNGILYRLVTTGSETRACNRLIKKGLLKKTGDPKKCKYGNFDGWVKKI